MLTQFPLALLPLHEIMTKFHKIVRRARDPYRPELHYMRGPGPKWHARHAPLLIHIKGHPERFSNLNRSEAALGFVP